MGIFGKMAFVAIPKVLLPGRKKIIAAVLILLAGFWGFNFFFAKKPAPLQFASVKRADIKSLVSSSGSLAGKSSATLKFKSAGKLGYINVKTGDQVFASEVVAGQDTKDLAIALKQAQNTLRDKQAAVDKIHDDVKGHDADETFTQRQTRTTAEAAVDNAFDSVKAAQRAFDDAVLVSPISGVVTQAIAVAGQNVSSSDIIAQVVDFSQILFDTDIDEADIGKISPGQKAEVNLDTYPDKTFEGAVSEIIPQTKTTSAGATVVTVRIDLNNAAITPINGLTGQASVILSEAKNVLTLPLEAVRDDQSVLVQEKDGLKAVKIEEGIKSDTDVEVKKGLAEGQRVLLNPPAPEGRVTQNRNPLQNVFRFFGRGR